MILVQLVQETAVVSSVTLKMRTEYQMSASTSVTSRENGAVHMMVIDEPLLVQL